MRRMLTSWLAMVAILVLVSAAAWFALESLHRQVEYREELAAIETADVIAGLVVDRNFDAFDLGQDAPNATVRAV